MHCINKFFLIVCILFSTLGKIYANKEQIIQQGKILFEENCTVCHAIHEEIVGPALKDVHKRQTVDWLKKFINNSQKVIQSGDEYAVKLYEKYNKTQMTSFDFSDKEIMDILAYIQAASLEINNTKSNVEKNVTVPKDHKISEIGNSNFISNKYFLLIIFGILSMLMLILLSLLFIIIFLIKNNTKNTLVNQNKKKNIFKKYYKKKIGTILLHSTTHYIGMLICLAFIGKTVIEALYTVGVQQNYAPTQPIAFSHKLHAGELNIDCQYCHTGVLKSKNANIPSVNICMNCHHQIKKNTPEIKKIHLAVEKNQPIEWIRVHNLPKLAYFNHAQHVKVGNISCEQCHGPVQDMEVIYQHQPLTMGWCIDCHRKTKVNAKDNAYYDRLLAIHQHQKKQQIPLKVVDIGGLECGKCHY